MYSHNYGYSPELTAQLLASKRTYSTQELLVSIAHMAASMLHVACFPRSAVQDIGLNLQVVKARQAA